MWKVVGTKASGTSQVSALKESCRLGHTIHWKRAMRDTSITDAAIVPTAPPMNPSHVFFGESLISGVRPTILPACMWQMLARRSALHAHAPRSLRFGSGAVTRQLGLVRVGCCNAVETGAGKVLLQGNVRRRAQTPEGRRAVPVATSATQVHSINRGTEAYQPRRP
jgi:hypothetical protein